MGKCLTDKEEHCIALNSIIAKAQTGNVNHKLIIKNLPLTNVITYY